MMNKVVPHATPIRAIPRPPRITREVFRLMTLADISDPALQRYFKLRKQVFVDQLGWDVPVSEYGEIDQYDREDTFYIVAERDGNCVGGLRLNPTTTRFKFRGQDYSYMIRDAKLGLLPSIPADLMSEDAPQQRTTWEMTRVISQKEPVHLRNLIDQAGSFLQRRGVNDVLFHSRPGAGRICQIWGYVSSPVGPVSAIGDHKFQVFTVSTMNYKDEAKKQTLRRSN